MQSLVYSISNETRRFLQLWRTERKIKMRDILFRGKPVNKVIYTNFEKKFKNASFFSNGFVFGSLVIYENKYYIKR